MANTLGATIALTVHLKPAQHKALQKAADKLGWSLTRVVRELIDKAGK